MAQLVQFCGELAKNRHVSWASEVNFHMRALEFRIRELQDAFENICQQACIFIFAIVTKIILWRENQVPNTQNPTRKLRNKSTIQETNGFVFAFTITNSKNAAPFVRSARFYLLGEHGHSCWHVGNKVFIELVALPRPLILQVTPASVVVRQSFHITLIATYDCLPID